MNVAVDIIIYAKKSKRILFVQRKYDPYKDCFALPGGFVEEDEDLLSAARRELEEETGIKLESLTQLYTVGNPKRDPRGYSVSIIYYALLDEEIKAVADTDAKECKWINIDNLPKLAFDHNEIIDYFKNELRLCV